VTRYRLSCSAQKNGVERADAITIRIPVEGGGLVDEYELVVHPLILGGARRSSPDLERPAGLRLLETRMLSSGVVYLGFAAR
jgi:riboflavin biosynthesis pyrimidine reductase